VCVCITSKVWSLLSPTLDFVCVCLKAQVCVCRKKPGMEPTVSHVGLLGPPIVDLTTTHLRVCVPFQGWSLLFFRITEFGSRHPLTCMCKNPSMVSTLSNLGLWGYGFWISPTPKNGFCIRLTNLMKQTKYGAYCRQLEIFPHHQFGISGSTLLPYKQYKGPFH